MSTGMKQKISIALSVIHDPEVVIFDEPTNGLDVITAKTVTDYLYKLKEEGKTVILTTHLMYLAEELGAAILVKVKLKKCIYGKMSNIWKLMV